MAKIIESQRSTKEDKLQIDFLSLKGEAHEFRREITEALVNGHAVLSVEKSVTSTLLGDSSQPTVQQNSTANTTWIFCAGLGPDASASVAESGILMEEENVSECSFSQFEVKCSHYAKRGYKLDVINSINNLNGNSKVRRVVDKDNIVVDFSGSCSKGNTDCLSGAGPKGTKSGSGGPLEFTVAPKPNERCVNDFWVFF